MRKTLIGPLAALVLVAAPARADPADTLDAMFAALGQCLSPVRLAKGTDVTVRFMLNRRGGIIGKPRLAHAQWAGDDAQRRQSAASIASGFDRCLPLAITDGLGGAIAGRLIAYRLRGPERDDKS